MLIVAPASTDYLAKTLQVLSWVINLAGVAIGAIGLAIAQQQSKKAESSEQAVRRVKRDLYNQKAAQSLTQMGAYSGSLITNIRNSEWPRAMDSLIGLGGQIANSIGAFPDLVGVDGYESLQGCARDLTAILENLPIDNSMSVESSLQKDLLRISIDIDLRLQKIVGHMRLELELEKSDERRDQSTAARQPRIEVGEDNSHKDGTEEIDLD